MNSYEDIIHLERPPSRRAKMSALNRAAQFAPFAALTGYDATVRETGRLTEKRVELDENEKAILNGKLRFLAEHLGEKPAIRVIFFQPDRRKEGGAYLTLTGRFRKIDPYSASLCFEDGTAIPIEDIYGLTIQTRMENVSAVFASDEE